MIMMEATLLGTDMPSLMHTKTSSAAASVAAAAAWDNDLPVWTWLKRSLLPGGPAPSNPLDEHAQVSQGF
ncbi:hypothetical protein K439DRAFT_1638741 [Ramaria rubella]|nr:hypothetical protein K439DRAFT_1638741 [Ramaria rubella]